MKIYTKRGDQGNTSLLGQGQIPKYHPRVSAYGLLDQLNSFLGLAHAELSRPDSPLTEILERTQNLLFVLGSHLACVDPQISLPKLELNQEISWLEQWIDSQTEKLPPLKNFILPGGHRLAAQLHVARAFCRQVEREFSQPSWDFAIPYIPYLNRLSDALFVAARLANYENQTSERLWKP